MTDIYGVWCEVWGGVTGSRSNWMKLGGKLAIFCSAEAAETSAQQARYRTKNFTSHPAQFRYTVKPFSVMRPEQLDALVRIRDHGSGAWAGGKSRAGGAVSRMFDRLVELGLVTSPPHTLTESGRTLLKALGR